MPDALPPDSKRIFDRQSFNHPNNMPLKPIPEKAHTLNLAAPKTSIHSVRLILVINPDIKLKTAWVEGAVITKWISKGGLLFWEKTDQPVTGTLDVRVRVNGGPDGAAALVTICDGQKAGTINLATGQTGYDEKEESYDV